jgi:hypothetical protein
MYTATVQRDINAFKKSKPHQKPQQDQPQITIYELETNACDQRTPHKPNPNSKNSVDNLMSDYDKAYVSQYQTAPSKSNAHKDSRPVEFRGQQFVAQINSALNTAKPNSNKKPADIKKLQMKNIQAKVAQRRGRADPKNDGKNFQSKPTCELMDDIKKFQDDKRKLIADVCGRAQEPDLITEKNTGIQV